MDARERTTEFDYDTGIGRQESLADDAPSGTLPAEQNALEVAAVFMGHEKGCKRRPTGKVNDLDIVAGIVEQLVCCRLFKHDVRPNQRVVRIVQSPQQIVVWPTLDLTCLADARIHREFLRSVSFTVASSARRLCAQVDRLGNSDVVAFVPGTLRRVGRRRRAVAVLIRSARCFKRSWNSLRRTAQIFSPMS